MVDPKLNIDEQSLFEFMRDEVITGLSKAAANGDWLCTTNIVETEGRGFPFPRGHKARQTAHQHPTALGAFMKARAEIVAAILSGLPVYTAKTLAARKKLGL